MRPGGATHSGENVAEAMGMTFRAECLPDAGHNLHGRRAPGSFTPEHAFS